MSQQQLQSTGLFGEEEVERYKTNRRTKHHLGLYSCNGGLLLSAISISTAKDM